MKKKILLALLAVGLLVTGFASGVYAIEGHNPVKGNKLVGCGALGKHGENPILKDSSMFTFTNPDCSNSITIERVSIIRGDGVLIYEGPYLYIRSDGTRVPLIELKPHRQGKIELWNWIWDETEGRWLSESEARELPIYGYTTEIEWKATGATCPLMGYGHRTLITIIPGQPASKVSYHIPMNIMKGHLK